jgi:hypothetical protein
MDPELAKGLDRMEADYGGLPSPFAPAEFVSGRQRRMELPQRVADREEPEHLCRERAEAEARAQLASERRSQVGTGDRSEKIRTYNFPQNRVTDHRIGFDVHSLPKFMDGEIEDMLDALARSDGLQQ